MSQIIVSCNSGDCWNDKDGNFSSTGNELYIADSNVSSNGNVITWIPFTIPIGRATIQQAYITVTASANRSAGSGNLGLWCEDADNPSTPVSSADLNSRVFTSFSSVVSLGAYVLNTEYTYQIDNPVSEIFDRPGFGIGNTMAVIIREAVIGDIGDAQRDVYSYEGDAAKRAYLTINFTKTVPRTSYFY